MEIPAPSSFDANLILGATIIATAALVVWLMRRAEPHNRGAGRWVALAAAITVLVVCWLSPVATVAQHYLLTGHLLQITLVMGVAPPLLLLSLPMRPRVAVPTWLGKLLRALVHPVPAVVAVNAAFFGWHLTGPFDAALSNPSLYSLQQLTLLLASLMFWWPIVTPLSPPVRAMSPLGKLGYILLATIPQTFGGLIVALAHHALYPGYGLAPRLFQISLMTDQELAGVCIALVSKVSLFAAFFVIFMRALQSSSAEGDEGGGGGGGRGPSTDSPRPVPSGTGVPRWLEDLEAGRTAPEPAPPPRVRVPAGSGSGRG